MPKASIDYMNARRDRGPASGGTDYAKRRVSTKAADRARVDLKDRDAGRDSLELAHDAVWAIFDDFRAFIRESDNRLAAMRLGADVGNEEIPF